MVTHDRYFLDRVCSKIIEIDRSQIYIHEGNYANYLRRRRERIEAMTSELAKVKNTLRREQEWMNRQPQARAGKARYRIDAFHDLKQRAAVDLRERNVELSVKSSYIGSKIFEATHICKKFGEKRILDDFSYIFSRYEKVGIIGRNGVGKSTFIKMLQGIVQPDAGRFDVGETVRFGYYSQDGLKFDKGKRVVDAIADLAEEIVLEGGERHSPMQYLQRFLFTPKDQQKYISTLSGGELARLHLAAVLMRSPNFLILDEPTAGLDPKGRDEILDLIAGMQKERNMTVILVSHSMEDVANYVNRMLVMKEGSVLFDGAPKEVFSHYKELEAVSLAAPQVTYLMNELRESGMPVNADATTIEEAKQEILRAFQKKGKVC